MDIIVSEVHVNINVTLCLVRDLNFVVFFACLVPTVRTYVHNLCDFNMNVFVMEDSSLTVLLHAVSGKPGYGELGCVEEGSGIMSLWLIVCI